MALDERQEMYTRPPRPGEQQLSKRQAGYVAHGPFGCQNCQWFERSQAAGTRGFCKPIGNEPIDARACCDFWNVADAPSAVGKAACEYVYIPGADYTCVECIYFDPTRDECWPVVGHISPFASCNKWVPYESLPSERP